MADLPSLKTLEPTEAEGFLISANGMLAGARPLKTMTPVPVFALTLLCGHACEAALKAMLSESGFELKKLSSSPYGHNISNLWQAAKAQGYHLPSPQPDWVNQLNSVYDKPFHLRYPLGFHGISLPNQEAMLEGTVEVVALAAAKVTQGRNA